MKKFLALVFSVFMCVSCASKKYSTSVASSGSTSREAYEVQVGAFKDVNNAARFVDMMNSRGLDAFLFKEDNLYKVRFGNYKTYNDARAGAKSLQNSGKIGEFFIISPEDYAVNKKGGSDNYLRNEIVKAAERYIGVPYVWGGESSAGFDCSGLMRAIYRLNGIKIPRVSRDQYNKGRFIKKSDLKKGDLVFFATTKRNTVTHVGVYIGNNVFIHSPRKGATVRRELLTNKYWVKAYMGGRSYI